MKEPGELFPGARGEPGVAFGVRHAAVVAVEHALQGLADVDVVAEVYPGVRVLKKELKVYGKGALEVTCRVPSSFVGCPRGALVGVIFLNLQLAIVVILSGP